MALGVAFLGVKHAFSPVGGGRGVGERFWTQYLILETCTYSVLADKSDAEGWMYDYEVMRMTLTDSLTV
jgi:hypothetical protein